MEVVGVTVGEECEMVLPKNRKETTAVFFGRLEYKLRFKNLPMNEMQD